MPKGEIEMAAVASDKPLSRAKLPLGLLLLAGLLILRFPVMAALPTFMHPVPAWVSPLFYNGTYVLNAALIFWERDRLEQFQVDRWALGIYILTPLLLTPVAGYVFLSWVQVACVAVLGAALLVTRTRLPRAQRATLIWLGAAVVLGVALGVFNGYCIRWQAGGAPRTVPAALFQLLPMFVTQLTRAASLEEPLFRGFLWGYLRLAGWKDVWIWLFQAGLFMLGHVYYFGQYNVSFWVIVPIGGLVIGWTAWRARSIGASMIVHGFGNSLGDLVGHFRW